MKLTYSVVSEWKYKPAETLRHAQLAENAGFDGVIVSDHFHPFLNDGMNAPFSWVWLSAAAERTKSVSLGTGATSPILRYNPAIIAQAFATLGIFYPGRIFLTLAAGESLNESPCGYPWPSPRERVVRLEEAIQIIKLLWSKKFVSFTGKYFSTRSANLYSKPTEKIPLYVAFDGPGTAAVAGAQADGFLYPTHNASIDKLERFRKLLLPAFVKGAKSAGRNVNEYERIASLATAYSQTESEAISSLLGRRGNLLPGVHSNEIYDPRLIQEQSKSVSEERLRSTTLITCKADEYVQAIEKLAQHGFTHVVISNWGPDAYEFFEFCKSKLIPELKATFREK